MDELVKNGLVFELGDGLLVDTAGNNTVTNNGATLTADHNGRANRGWNTNVATQYLEVNDTDSLDITGDCTIVWYGKIGTYSTATKTYVNKWQDYNNYWIIGQYVNNNRLRLMQVVGGVTVVDIYYLSVTTYNDYAMYAWILDSINGNSFYINGTKITVPININTGAYGNNTGEFRLGKYNPITPADNVIHEKIQKFNRTLTESEIKKLYNYWRSH